MFDTNDLATVAVYTQKAAADHVKSAVDFNAVRELLQKHPALSTVLLGGLGGAAGHGTSALANMIAGKRNPDEDDIEARKRRNRLAAIAGALGGVGLGVFGSADTGNINIGDLSLTPEQAKAIGEQAAPGDPNNVISRMLSGITSATEPGFNLPFLGGVGIGAAAGAKSNAFSDRAKHTKLNDILSRVGDDGKLSPTSMVPKKYHGLDKHDIIRKILGTSERAKDRYVDVLEAFDNGPNATTTTRAGARMAKLSPIPGGTGFAKNFTTGRQYATQFRNANRLPLATRLGRMGAGGAIAGLGLTALDKLFSHD